MGRLFLFLFLFLFLNSLQAVKTSGDNDKVAILAFLKNSKLDTHPKFKKYFERTMNHVQKMDRFDYWYEFHLKSMSLRKVSEGYYIYELTRNGRKEDLAFLYLALKELNIDKGFQNLLKYHTLQKAEDVNFNNRYVINTSSNNKQKIILPSQIYLRNVLKQNKLYEKLYLTIKTRNYGGKIYAYSEFPEYVDTFKHCIRLLMRDYQIDDCSVRIDRWNDKISRTIAPLDLYMRLRSPSGQTKHYYYGGFHPNGKIRNWGNFIKFYEYQDTKMTDSRKKRCYLPVTSIDVLRDLMIVEGISLVTKINFIGIQNVSELKNTESKNCKASDLFQNAIASTKDPKALLIKMNDVLKINKNHLSAILVKEALQKKVPTRMSIKSSFEAFQFLYFHLREKHSLQWISYNAQRDENGKNYLAIKSIVEKVKKYTRKAHPNMAASYKALYGCASSFLEIFESIRNKKSFNPGDLKSYHSQIRNINYSWNLVLDSQRLLDGVFK